MNVAIRRATGDDVDYLVELMTHEEVDPFLSARRATTHAELAETVARSEREPADFGVFVIEVDGERAGTMSFDVANRRSRVAHLGKLAVHPDFRGRRISDEAARQFQQHLIWDLGFHRLQLEIYAFNERAIAHAGRSGFVPEGRRRRAYWRHGEWVDGVMFGLVREDLEPNPARALLHDHVMLFNEAIRTGDFAPMLEHFADDAELAFEGVPAGPFHGRDAIAEAYRDQPPDDELDVLDVREEGDTVIAGYAWRREPAKRAGEMHLTHDGASVRRLVVTFD